MANELQKRVTIFLNGKQVEGTVGNLRKKSRELNREINKLTPGTQKYIAKAKELQSVNSTITKHRQNVKGINGAYKSAQGGLSKFKNLALGVFAGGGLLGIATGVLTGIKNGVVDIIKTNKEFEKGLSSLSSITGATGKDLEFYRKEAKEIGSTTTLSASQAVDAFKLIGSARPELLKNKEALTAVTREAITLAEAAGIELPEAAQSLAGTLNGLNLESSESNRVINALAAGSKEGAAGIVEQTQALDAFAPIAASNNVTLEENIGLIETLAEKNIKGAEAGTKLRNVITTLATVKALPPEALSQLEKFGVNTDIVSDSSLTLEERLTELAKIQGDNTALVKVFGKQNLVAGQTILQNVDSVKRYTDAVTGTNTAQEQAKINTDNLDGDLKSLSSTWEGITLRFQQGGGIIRKVVQGFTLWLKSLDKLTTGIINLAKGFANLDLKRIASGFLTLFDHFSFGVFNLGKYADELVRVGDLSEKVIEAVKEQATEVDILTTALGENNEALNSNKLTEEEAKAVKEENSKIINRLKEEYPELTGRIEDQTLSSKDLSAIQREITDNLIKQQIEVVKAAEKQKILDEIFQKSIEISRQAQKEKGRFAITNFIADTVSDDAEDLEAQQEDLKNQLENIDKTFSDVEKNINELDINFGEKFDANADLVKSAEIKLAGLKIKQKIGIFGNAEATAKEIEAQEEIIKNGIEARKKSIDELTKINVPEVDNENDVNETSTKKRKSSTLSDKEAKKQAQLLAKQLQDVEKLKNAVNNFRNEINNAEKIDLLQTDEAKELEKLQQTIDKKFAKEITNAENLAQQKGEIGEKGTELLNALTLIKEKELQNGIEVIKSEYASKRLSKRKEEALAENETVLKAVQTAANLEVVLANEKFESISEREVEAKEQAQEQLSQALKNRLSAEKEIEINALLNKFDQQLISEEEYQLQKQLIENKYREQADQLDAAATEKQKARKQAVIDASKQLITEGSQIIADFTQVQAEKQIEKDNASKESEIAKLEDRRKRGLVSDKQYEDSKSKIEATYAKKKRAEEIKVAKAQRAAAIIQAGINTAVAVSAGMASPAVPPFPSAIAAGILGVAQIALITAKPIPQFKDGGLHTVTGATDNKQYKANYLGRHGGGMLPSTPSLVLASEKGPEYFVPNHLLMNPAVADSVRLIESIRVGQFMQGGFNNPVSTDAVPTTNDQASKLTQEQQQVNLAMVSVIERLSSTIDKGLPVNIGDDKVNDITNKQTEIDAIVNR